MASTPAMPIWQHPCSQWLLRGLLVCLVSACSEGYDTNDLSLGDRPAAADPATIVDRLNRMNRDSLTESRWRFSLNDVCELTLKAQRPDGRAEVLTLPLRHSEVQVKGNINSESHGVELAYDGEPALGDERVFEAQRWTEAVEYATQLHALQRSCAPSR